MRGRHIHYNSSDFPADSDARSPEQLVAMREAQEVISAVGPYSALEAPSTTVIICLANLYGPGMLSLANSDGGLEAGRLCTAIVNLRDTIGDVRRSMIEKPEPYDWGRAGRAVPLFALAIRTLSGFCAAKRLEPKPFPQLLRAHLEAALTLVTAGSRTAFAELAQRVPVLWEKEMLELRYSGIPRRNYPLDVAEAAEETEWLPVFRDGAIVKGKNERIPHVEGDGQVPCAHCLAQKPTATTMSGRNRRLREVLIAAIWPQVKGEHLKEAL